MGGGRIPRKGEQCQQVTTMYDDVRKGSIHRPGMQECMLCVGFKLGMRVMSSQRLAAP